mgnify:CR=1 FL=1|jgi:hypothetical protein
MKRTYWVFAACLSLLLLGGLAYDVSAQQSAPPAAAPSAPPTEPTKPSVTPPTSTESPSGQMRQDTPQPPASSTIERNTEKTTVVDHDSGRIFGMQPTVAMIIGAVLLVVIVLGLVAMSRGGGRDTTEVHEHHHRV